MNTFAVLQLVRRYRKVAFYTVWIEGEPASLFRQFDEAHQGPEYQLDLQTFYYWIKKIGNEEGAKEKFFRFEAAGKGDARALPPPAELRGPKSKLRLYCMRCSDRVVILFSGAVKTTRRPQDCPNVQRHFRLANKLCVAIQDAYRDGDICEDAMQPGLLFRETFKIIL